MNSKSTVSNRDLVSFCSCQQTSPVLSYKNANSKNPGVCPCLCLVYEEQRKLLFSTIFFTLLKKTWGRRGNGESISAMLHEIVFSFHHILYKRNWKSDLYKLILDLYCDLLELWLIIAYRTLPYFQCSGPSGYGFGWPVINWPPGSGPDPCYIIKKSKKFHKKF